MFISKYYNFENDKSVICVASGNRLHLKPFRSDKKYYGIKREMLTDYIFADLKIAIGNVVSINMW